MATRYKSTSNPAGLPCPSDGGHNPANESEVDPLDAILIEVEDMSDREVAQALWSLRDEVAELRRQWCIYGPSNDVNYREDYAGAVAAAERVAGWPGGDERSKRVAVLT